MTMRHTATFYDGPHRGETRTSTEPRLHVTEVLDLPRLDRWAPGATPVPPDGGRYRIDCYSLRRDPAGKLWWVLEPGAA